MSTDEQSEARPRRGPLRRLLDWAALVLLAGAVAWVVLFFVFAPELPDTDEVWSGDGSPAVLVLAADGSRLDRRGAVGGRPVAVEDLPPALVQALIATEDTRFYEHFGLDVIGLGRALVANIRAGGIVQGGSTITQQLAKNLYLTPERTLSRKIEELILAVWLEARLTKNQILTLYLNRVYFGAGAYGIESAAQVYFDKPARDLTLAESAMLVGLLKAPSRYAPTRNPQLARERAAQVLANMVAAGSITEAQAAAARARPAKVAPRSAWEGADHFVDWAVGLLPETLTASAGEVVVRTTLVPEVQRAAERAVTGVLDREGPRGKASQAAAVVLDGRGRVLAMVGGRAYRSNPFNRATEARRQPGSAFKTFVYLAAMEVGMTPGDTLVDREVTVDGWTPRNYDGRHRGRITLRDAFAGSVNTVAVALQERIGRQRVIDAARRLGISGPLEPVPSLALGTFETSLIELTAAYVPFMNGGRRVEPEGVDALALAGGQRWRPQSAAAGRQVIAPGPLRQMRALLRAVVESGTGRAARVPGLVTAGKTGTTQDNRDAWFVGITPSLAIGVWVGNDDNAPMAGVTGGGMPARIWRAIAAAVPAELAVARAPEPEPLAEGDPVSRLFDWLFGDGDGAVDADEVADAARDVVRWVIERAPRGQPGGGRDPRVLEDSETRGR